MRLPKQCSTWVALALLSWSACSGRTPAAPEPVAVPNTVRQLRDGEVIGSAGRYGGYVWRGVPYAAPPTGARRWRAPVPRQPWAGRRDALRAASPCAQLASPFGGINDRPVNTPVGDEDCLYLDVYAPVTADGATDRAPVMVWIHGGGNVIGHAGFYDGSNLATTESVVVVVPQYRLGPLGWLRHAALRAGTADAVDRSGNFGTLDQIRSLEWVRDNIAAFGGDPDNVTIFGESAGGRNVVNLLLAPGAGGLFHRAIAQSGRVRLVTPDEAERPRDAAPPGHAGSSHEMLLQLLVNDGRARDRDAAAHALAGMPEEEIASYLRGKTPATLLGGYRSEIAEGLIEVPNCFADGTVLPDADGLELLARAGRHNQVPTMLGTNRDEMKIFMFPSERWVRKLLWLVPRRRDPALYDATAALLSDLWKVDAVDEPAAALTGSGNGEVFAYRWDWDEEPTVFGADLTAMIGAAHGLEIPFIFGHFDLGPEINVIFTDDNAPGRRALSRTMMSYWANFAREGHPGRGSAGDLAEWRPWPASAGSGALMVLDRPGAGGARVEATVLTEADVWDRFRADRRLVSDERRCEALSAASLYNPTIDVATFARFGCAAE